MYDINKFLEKRSEVSNQIERLQFKTDEVGDYDYDDLEFEIDINGVTLYVEATIKETLTDMERESRDEPASYTYERELEDVNSAYYVDSECSDRPCTQNEIEAIKNVIKSLL